jgi:hypothetical protein
MRMRVVIRGGVITPSAQCPRPMHHLIVREPLNAVNAASPK